MSIANRLVMGVLDSPMHRLLSNSLLTLIYTGRRSGATYSLPVGYVEIDGEPVVLVGRPEAKTWWHNFAEPIRVGVRLRGRHRFGRAALVPADEAAGLVRAYFAARPRAARAFGITDVGDEAAMDAATRGLPVIRVVLD